MNWSVKYIPEAVNDLKKLAGNQRILVIKAIEKVKNNPISSFEGGYGKPLGKKNGSNLSGFLIIILRAAGIRVVYKVIKSESEMLIVVIGARADDEGYEIAAKRIHKNNL